MTGLRGRLKSLIKIALYKGDEARWGSWNASPRDRYLQTSRKVMGSHGIARLRWSYYRYVISYNGNSASLLGIDESYHPNIIVVPKCNGTPEKVFVWSSDGDIIYSLDEHGVLSMVNNTARLSIENPYLA